MGFVERLKTLMKREVSGYRLAKDIGVNNSIRSWLKGRAEYPRGENLKKLSKYFGVHPRLLYGEEQYTPNLESPLYTDVYLTFFVNQPYVS